MTQDANGPGIEVAAYYFPSYHPDPRNDGWHGAGWTEWELVRAARPRFDGHRQPKQPAWGCFDEADPAWAAREVELAADHGITSFLFDWYWYDDRPYLHDALERGFLQAPNRQRLRFALMWANHDWNNIFPARLTNRPEVLAPGAVTPAVFDHLCDYVIERYFTQPNYLTIDGRPYFSIYELGTLVRSFGGLDAAAAALDQFRDRCRRAGLPGLHLNTVVWQLQVLQSEQKLDDVGAAVRRLGIDSATSYAWVHHFRPGATGFPRCSYTAAAEVNYAAWTHFARALPTPYFPNVSMGWDPSPRTCPTDRFEERGYPWTAILEGNTPAAFEQSLRRARSFVAGRPTAQRLVTINAWNEWTEGSYLLPDAEHGEAYLQAVQRVFSAAPSPRGDT